MSPKKADVVIRKSRIHGKGAFAARDFRKGEAVIDWSECSTPLTGEQVDGLPESRKRLVSYKGQGRYVLFKPPASYVNHSCDSNTRPVKGRDVAVRGIKRGEEITADYVVERSRGLDMLCNCGSRRCKGRVRLPDKAGAAKH